MLTPSNQRRVSILGLDCAPPVAPFCGRFRENLGERERAALVRAVAWARGNSFVRAPDRALVRASARGR